MSDDTSDLPLEQEGDLLVAHLRIRSQHTAIELIDRAIDAAYQRGARRLLILSSAEPDVEPPSIAQRSIMVRGWAQTSRGVVTVAMVCEPRFIDTQRFGITIAAISGMTANVFTDEREARDWLSQQP